MVKRLGWFLVRVAALLVASSCAGEGCSCLSPTPGGFPSASRAPNAVQARVSDTLFDKLEEDPAGLLAGFTGSESLQFPIPESCGGTLDICCGTPSCGPLDIDVTPVGALEQPGAAEARLELDPVQGQGAIDLTLRARLTTVAPINVSALSGLLSCDISIDTSNGSTESATVRTRISLPVDGQTDTTRVELDDVQIDDLEDEDIIATNCPGFIADNLGLLAGQIDTLIAGQLEGAIATPLCKKCPTGDATDCGEFADSCSEDGLCMRGDQCLQELGISGRLIASSAFADFSPTTTGAVDIYEVASGYANSDNGGVSAGLLSGMLPAGEV
ncbi:MAG: hypothetical protein KJO07_18800, partial [Deltaproteobacteria bacterium]|nr:hypothetical protein [Deltaproteobacteria bacterium]